MRGLALAAALLVGLAVLVPAFGRDAGLGLFVLYVFAVLLAAAVPPALAAALLTRRRRWFDVTTLVATAWLALVLTLGTLAVDQTAATGGEAERLAYGYPIHFVYADQTRFDPPSYPHAFRFSPWETPHSFSPARFALSFLIVYVALLALLRLLAAARRAAPHAPGRLGAPVRWPGGH